MRRPTAYLSLVRLISFACCTLAVFGLIGLLGVSQRGLTAATYAPQAVPASSPADIAATSAFTKTAALLLNREENYFVSGVLDPLHGFAYFGTVASGGTFTYPGLIVKVRLADFKRVGVLNVGPDGGSLYSAVIDPEGGFAYFATDNSPARIL